MTDSSSEDHSTDAGEDEVFSQRLAEFAESGCRILVTGEVPPEASMRHMRRALGERQGSRYGQVVVHSRDADQVLPAGVDVDDPTVRVISRERYRRSATSRQDAGTVNGRALDQLRTEIWTAIDEIHTGHDPVDVRVAIDALGVFFDAYPFERVVRFITDVSQHVTLIDGRAYYYVNRLDGSELVGRLADVVDARVELRYDRGESSTFERWHLPEDDVSTDWIEV